jgi:hypothetical protein
MKPAFEGAPLYAVPSSLVATQGFRGALKSPRSQIIALNLLFARTHKPAFNPSRFF